MAQLDESERAESLATATVAESVTPGHADLPATAALDPLDPLAQRRAEALTGLQLSNLSGVEFGPLDRPIVTPAMARVLYADHCSTEELRAKYAADPGVNLAGLPPVDIDLSRTTLGEAARSNGGFNFVVASHVIEHVPDLIGWLIEAADALRSGGVIVLMVPDKRFTFDLHRRETTWRDLEEAHAERRTRPSLGTVLDHFLNVVSTDTGALWRDYSVGLNAPRLANAAIAGSLIEQWSQGRYIDAHCGVWTPWSFMELLGRAIIEHIPDLRLLRAESTPVDQLDFWVQLVKSPETPMTDWKAEAFRLRIRSPRPELALS